MQPTTTSEESSGTLYRQNANLSTTVDHPRLMKEDPLSIRIFLRRYDAYCNEVRARAEQMVLQGSPSTTEISRPVNLKYCVDTEYLEAAILLKRIEGVSSYDALTDEKLRTFLKTKGEESTDVVTLGSLDILVRDNLRMNMNDNSAKSRMESLFISYIMLLRKHGLVWVQEKNQKVAVGHVLSAIRPLTLQRRLDDDLQFAHTNLRKDFSAFMDHAIDVAEAYQKVQGDATRQRHQLNIPRVNRKSAITQQHSSHAKTSNNVIKGRESPDSGPKNKKPLPPCPFHVCKAKGLRHWINDCRNSSFEEKNQMRKEFARLKSAAGPSLSTRSRKDSTQLNKPNTSSNSSNTSITRRVEIPKSITESNKRNNSDMVIVAAGAAKLEVSGRCDDGADDSVVSKSLAEKAVATGIGHIEQIPKTEVLMPVLNTDQKPISFSSTKVWKVSRTILHVISGPLALCNVSYLVINGELAPEQLLIGRPVLKHLGVDTSTLLDKNRLSLDGHDCIDVGNPTAYVRRMMLSRISGNSSSANLQNEETSSQTADATNSSNNLTSMEVVRPRKNYFVVRDEPDTLPEDFSLEKVDENQEEDIVQALEDCLRTCVDNQLSSEDIMEMRTILLKHKDIFRIRLGGGPPAKLPPMKINLAPEAKPIRVRLRNYSQQQKEFLANFVGKLMKYGIVYSNPTSAWAAAPHLVPKRGLDEYRFTVDLRPVNKYTIQSQFPMPNLEHELQKLSGSRYFANMDLSNAYWQLPLEEDSQHLQSFITPDGIYTPRRVLHGTTNAVSYLQSNLSAILTPFLRDHVLIWLDDVLIYASSMTDLFQSIQEFFILCRTYRLYLHPKKCIMFTTRIRWCGRLITPKGIRFDPENYEGLCNMKTPQTAGDLQQFMCALQWIRTTIPNFSELVQPLRVILNKAFVSTARRSKRNAARILLKTVQWGHIEEECFEKCKQAVKSQVLLVHRDNTKRLCLFTDASDTGWAGILTQIPANQVGTDHEIQDHQPLAFLSGHFNETQLSWATVEKEAYAIIASCIRMHWLLATPEGFDIYTDHNNLIFMFDPLAVVSDLSLSSVKKVIRWAVRMSTYNYVCYHIKGKQNVWADMISRWTPGNVTLRRLVHIPPLVTSSEEETTWPTVQEIIEIQKRHRSSLPQTIIEKNGIYITSDNAISIPPDENLLQLRICIIAHCGAAGHRGFKNTMLSIKDHFFWKEMEEDVKRFVASCIHCVATTRGNREPRPFGPAVHGTSANDLIQFDFLEIGPSATGMKYILMIRDDLSSYSWLILFAKENAKNASDGLFEWCTTFSTPKALMSDGGSHFRNDTVRLLTKALRVPHDFTLPYTSWSNGAVERLGREVLRVFRATLSELRLPSKKWPALVPVLQSAINISRSSSRNDMALTTIFIGHIPSVLLFLYKLPSTGELRTIPQAIRETLNNLSEFKNCLDNVNSIVQPTLQ